MTSFPFPKTVGKQDSSERIFRVLVADDDHDARTLVSTALDEQPLELSFVEDGSQALTLCAQAMPDLAIIDLQMPGNNGIEVCQWIKENCGDSFIPVILLTSQSDPEYMISGLNCGADDYICKPFSFAELIARVQALLRIKILNDQLHQTRNQLADKEKELIAMHVAGAAAHELGQPLTSILLHCELLASLEPKGPGFSEALNTIIDECHRIREVLSRLHSVEGYKVKSYAANLKILDLTDVPE